MYKPSLLKVAGLGLVEAELRLMGGIHRVDRHVVSVDPGTGARHAGGEIQQGSRTVPGVGHRWKVEGSDVRVAVHPLCNEVGKHTRVQSRRMDLVRRTSPIVVSKDEVTAELVAGGVAERLTLWKGNHVCQWGVRQP